MAGDEPVGFTCQSFYSVSAEPPLVSFSVMTTSFAYPRIRESGRFSVNVLAHDQHAVSNQFARAGFLENPKNALHFVGYADPDSPAGHLRSSQTGDKVVLDDRYAPVARKCEMEVFDFSGHATRESLLEFILKVRPKKAFLVHGDPKASTWFVDQLREKLPGTEAIVPEPGRDYVIG